jgi:cardiolipin synthase (CMP-forming)
VYTLPNLISLARMVLGLPTAWCILGGQEAAAVALILLAAFTDFLDGWLARQSSPSALGILLDPLADKVFIAVVVMAMAAAGILPWWLLAVIVGRDLLILLGGLYVQSRVGKVSLPARWPGKVSTTVQFCTLLALFARDINWLNWLVPVGYVLTPATALVSAGDYLMVARRLLQRGAAAQDSNPPDTHHAKDPTGPSPSSR